MTIFTNKTKFTVDELANLWYAGYVIDVTKTAALAENSENAYTFIRSCLFDYHVGAEGTWSTGAKYNAHTFGETTINNVIVGATVQLNIRRFDTYLIIRSDITTTTNAEYHHYYVQDLGTTDDIYIFLCGDYAKLTITSDVTADTSFDNPVEMLIGKEDNTDGWASTYINPLKPNSSMSLHFKNYTNGASATNTYDNWTVQFNFWEPTANDNAGADQWFNLTSADLNPWGEISTNKKRGTAVRSSNWPSTDSDIKTKFNNADVTLTITRCGDEVTFVSVMTPESGEPFGFKYTLVPSDTWTNFAESDIYIRLIGRNCHMYNYYPISKVNAEVSQYGWATFSSPYKLDFSDITGLQAYAVTGHSGTAITKSDALGVVAANAGVLLKGTEGTTSTFYNIPVSTGEAYDGTNLMVAGTGAAVDAGSGVTRYVLGVNETTNEAEFQKIVGTPATVAAGKAYLQFNEVISGARALRMSFGDETAVESVKAAAETAKKNGAYLENGKIAIYKNGVKFNVAGQQMK